MPATRSSTSIKAVHEARCASTQPLAVNREATGKNQYAVGSNKIYKTDAVSHICVNCGRSEGMVDRMSLITHLDKCKSGKQNIFICNASSDYNSTGDVTHCCKMFTTAKDLENHLKTHATSCRKAFVPPRPNRWKVDLGDVKPDDVNKLVKARPTKNASSLCNVLHPTTILDEVTIWVLCGGRAGAGTVTRHKHRDHCGYYVPMRTGRGSEGKRSTVSTRADSHAKDMAKSLWQTAVYFTAWVHNIPTFEEAVRFVDVPIDFRRSLRRNARHGAPQFTLPSSLSLSKIRSLWTLPAKPNPPFNTEVAGPSASAGAHSTVPIDAVKSEKTESVMAYTTSVLRAGPSRSRKTASRNDKAAIPALPPVNFGDYGNLSLPDDFDFSFNSFALPPVSSGPTKGSSGNAPQPSSYSGLDAFTAQLYAPQLPQDPLLSFADLDFQLGPVAPLPTYPANQHLHYPTGPNTTTTTNFVQGSSTGQISPADSLYSQPITPLDVQGDNACIEALAGLGPGLAFPEYYFPTPCSSHNVGTSHFDTYGQGLPPDAHYGSFDLDPTLGFDFNAFGQDYTLPQLPPFPTSYEREVIDFTGPEPSSYFPSQF